MGLIVYLLNILIAHSIQFVCTVTIPTIFSYKKKPINASVKKDTLYNKTVIQSALLFAVTVNSKGVNSVTMATMRT